jgi:hypothetical protein
MEMVEDFLQALQQFLAQGRSPVRGSLDAIHQRMDGADRFDAIDEQFDRQLSKMDKRLEQIRLRTSAWRKSWELYWSSRT